jgi:hypothetical protein
MIPIIAKMFPRKGGNNIFKNAKVFDFNEKTMATGIKIVN